MSRPIYDPDWSHKHQHHARAAIRNGLVKAVECKRCHEIFYEAYDSTRKYHTTCQPKTKRRFEFDEVNN